MKDHEWAALEVGDQVKYEGGTDTSLHNAYQVAQIRDGTVYVTRIVHRRQLGSTAQLASTETVEIRRNSDEWSYMRLRPKIAVSGGFTVRRANGEVEYQKCPTPTTPAPRDQRRGVTVRREGLR